MAAGADACREGARVPLCRPAARAVPEQPESRVKNQRETLGRIERIHAPRGVYTRNAGLIRARVGSAEDSASA